MALTLFSGMTTASEIAWMLFLLITIQAGSFSGGWGEVQPIQQLGASYPRDKLVRMCMNDFQFPNTLALVTSCEVTLVIMFIACFRVPLCGALWVPAGERAVRVPNQPCERTRGRGALRCARPREIAAGVLCALQMARHMQQS